MLGRASFLLDKSAPENGALTYAQDWASRLRPVTRALILNQYARPSEGFLEAVAAVSLALQIAPVVLTLARSETEARMRECAMAEALTERGLAADFDFVVGCDVLTAVARAARWRRCSHVFVERRVVSRWRRWLFGDIMNQLRGISDSVTPVAFPGAAHPHIARQKSKR